MKTSPFPPLVWVEFEGSGKAIQLNWESTKLTPNLETAGASYQRWLRSLESQGAAKILLMGLDLPMIIQNSKEVNEYIFYCLHFSFPNKEKYWYEVLYSLKKIKRLLVFTYEVKSLCTLI